MTDDDRFFERLREDAKQLRYEPDAFVSTRIAARVRERIAAPQPSVSLFLARWLRPLAASVSALALVASLGAIVYEETKTETATIETLSADSGLDIAVAGDLYRVGD